MASNLGPQKDLTIPIQRAKWTTQFIMHFLCVVFFGAVAWFMATRPVEPGSIDNAALYAGCLIVITMPSLMVVLHLLMVSGKTGILIVGHKFSDRTRLFRRVRDIQVNCITSVKIVYRGRPFTGISREYRVEFNDQDTGKSGEFFLADYLVSREDMEKVAALLGQHLRADKEESN